MADFNYNVAMPWTSNGLRKRLEGDIRGDYLWLFQEYNAAVLPAKPYKQVLDYANVTVAVGDLLLQFRRGRDEFHVSIAPAHEPDGWYELGEAIDLVSDTSGSAGNYTMSDFERLFRANIEGFKVLSAPCRRERNPRAWLPGRGWSSREDLANHHQRQRSR